MKRYYRDKKELIDASKEMKANKDVLDENDDVENTVLRNEVEGFGTWNIRGLCSYSDKQKEVKKLIQKEGLQLCAILETHVKFKNIKKTCENVFGDWEYITNGEDNNKGCRIMIGWNNKKIQAWMISQSRQNLFLMVETIDKNSKFFCTVIYASNSGMERKKLWKDLEIQKRIICGTPWVILGDFNVTIKVSEHSNRSVNPFSEMTEFQDCINGIEVEDLHSEGFLYAWTKSLKNQKCRTLKKLDRVMVNEDFMEKYQHAHGVFLPYMVSDHSPIIALKKKLKLLSWRNGNVFERADELRKKVKESQKEVDIFPHDEKVKKRSCMILKEYQEAIQDEYSLNNIFKTKLSLEEALEIVRLISDPEIKNAMFEIKDSKALGLMDTHLGKILGEVNATLISLVLKIPIPGKSQTSDPLHAAM
ncbi:RNA-directed DNA polymerase, eukaryota, reverse transcriptase zinc-binding domain protein [Tanacetum coccineum]